MAWLEEYHFHPLGAAHTFPCEFQVKWATTPWETRQAMELRRQVFCAEQRIFEDSDLDEIDKVAKTIVATSYLAGHPDRVVGTVRIHESEAGLWWGSRLAVTDELRQHGRLGANLIRMAVSSAHSQGCERFLAHVQQQNVVMFQKLHWTLLEWTELHGRPHGLMQADLTHYPSCDSFNTGWTTTLETAKGAGTK